MSCTSAADVPFSLINRQDRPLPKRPRRAHGRLPHLFRPAAERLRVPLG
jgi:hypothetical protein